jgi:hypothetical protein
MAVRYPRWRSRDRTRHAVRFLFGTYAHMEWASRTLAEGIASRIWMLVRWQRCLIHIRVMRRDWGRGLLRITCGAVIGSKRFIPSAPEARTRVLVGSTSEHEAFGARGRIVGERCPQKRCESFMRQFGAVVTCDRVRHSVEIA